MRKEERKQSKKLYLMMTIMIFLIIFIDQLSKVLIIHYDDITMIPDKMILKQAEMQNVYDETSKSVTILTNLVIIGIILGIIKSDNQFVTRKTKILLSFAFAGGVSNIIDRLCRGSVVEFIHIGNFPAFNIADVCILIGWISFVAIFASFSAKELTKKKLTTEEEKKIENKDNTNS